MATKSIAWTIGDGNITLTYQGQGNGDITVNSDPNNLDSARSQTITIETTAGSPIIVKNFTVSQGACPFPVGDVRNFSYTGNVQSVVLPAGTYKLQCWGAQGGTCSSGYSGGKGGYSEGVLNLTSPTTVYIFVGGQGSSSGNGGWNGGGGGSGSSSYSSGNESGSSTFGCGGGATDIALVTSSMSYSSYRNNRSSASLLSRMIVAGGGSGGAYGYQKVTTQSKRGETINWEFPLTKGATLHPRTVDWVFEDSLGNIGNMDSYSASGGNMSYSGSGNLSGIQVCLDLSQYTDRFPITVTFNVNSAGGSANLKLAKAVNRTSWSSYSSEIKNAGYTGTGTKTITLTDSTYPVLFYYCGDNKPGMSITGTQASWYDSLSSYSASGGNASWSSSSDAYLDLVVMGLDLSSYSFPVDVEFTINSSGGSSHMFLAKSASRTAWHLYQNELIDMGCKYTGSVEVTLTDSTHPYLFFYCNDNKPGMSVSGTARVYYEPVTSESTDYQTGFVGGGTNGGGYSSSYYGKQNGAGSNGSFGFGANQTVTNYRYGAGCGGGGWYGGGNSYSDSGLSTIRQSGGGSGFVNTAANAQYRPSDYTGLQLDSGTTYAGNTSFPSTSGGTETGHSGNGYARITRLNPNIMEFGYTGAVQSQSLKAGKYKIECWGAQGGSYNTTYYGGKGGYSVGEINITEPTTVYIYVGGQGTGGTTSGAKAGGFNGGGLGYSTSTTYIECGGGGASDVRIGQDSLYARVIVAGGGGGAGSYSSSYRYAGGAGGGTSGATPSQYSTSYRAGAGGTQTAKGNSYYGSTANSTSYGTLAAFGVGAGAKSGTTSYQITGGGAGWYGGGYSRRGAGGGGSGYVYTSSTASNYPSGCLLDSTMYLTNAQTIAGNASMPSTSGSTETGHSGNGFIRITKI